MKNKIITICIIIMTQSTACTISQSVKLQIHKLKEIPMEDFFFEKAHLKEFKDKAGLYGPVSFAVYNKSILIPNRAENSILSYSLDSMVSQPLKVVNTKQEPLFIDYNDNGELIFSDANQGLNKLQRDGQIATIAKEIRYYFRVGKNDIVYQDGCTFKLMYSIIPSLLQDCSADASQGDYYVDTKNDIWVFKAEQGYVQNISQASKPIFLDLDTNSNEAFLTYKILGEIDSYLVILYASDNVIRIKYIDKNIGELEKDITIENILPLADSRMDDLIKYWTNDFIAKLYEKRLYLLRTTDSSINIYKVDLP